MPYLLYLFRGDENIKDTELTFYCQKCGKRVTDNRAVWVTLHQGVFMSTCPVCNTQIRKKQMRKACCLTSTDKKT